MIINTPQPVTPNDPEARKRIFEAMKEMQDSFIREQAEKDLRKDIAQRIEDEEDMPKSKFNAFSKNYYNGKVKFEEKLAKIEQDECDFYNLLPEGEETDF